MSIIKSNMTAPPPPTGGSLSSIGYMNSVRFPNDGTIYTSLATPDSTTQYTLSLWLKLADLTNTSTAQMILERARAPHYSHGFYISSLKWIMHDNGSPSADILLRDPSAWYHLLCVYGATGGFHQMWVNGKLRSSVAKTSTSLMAVAGSQWTLGKSGWSGTYPLKSGYIADVYYLDGVVPTVANGGLDADGNLQMLGQRVSDVWVPKAYSGSYGNAGFHLDFADSSNIGNDVSGNDNHWTVQ